MAAAVSLGMDWRMDNTWTSFTWIRTVSQGCFNHAEHRANNNNNNRWKNEAACHSHSELKSSYYRYYLLAFGLALTHPLSKFEMIDLH